MEIIRAGRGDLFPETLKRVHSPFTRMSLSPLTDYSLNVKLGKREVAGSSTRKRDPRRRCRGRNNSGASPACDSRPRVSLSASVREVSTCAPSALAADCAARDPAALNINSRIVMPFTDDENVYTLFPDRDLSRNLK